MYVRTLTLANCTLSYYANTCGAYGLVPSAYYISHNSSDCYIYYMAWRFVTIKVGGVGLPADRPGDAEGGAARGGAWGGIARGEFLWN